MRQGDRLELRFFEKQETRSGDAVKVLVADVCGYDDPPQRIDFVSRDVVVATMRGHRYWSAVAVTSYGQSTVYVYKVVRWNKSDQHFRVGGVVKRECISADVEVLAVFPSRPTQRPDKRFLISLVDATHQDELTNS